MKQSNFMSFSQLERQMRAAHQLRAETMAAGAVTMLSALARTLGAIRGRWLRITFNVPRKA